MGRQTVGRRDRTRRFVRDSRALNTIVTIACLSHLLKSFLFETFLFSITVLVISRCIFDWTIGVILFEIFLNIVLILGSDCVLLLIKHLVVGAFLCTHFLSRVLCAASFFVGEAFDISPVAQRLLQYVQLVLCRCFQ